MLPQAGTLAWSMVSLKRTVHYICLHIVSSWNLEEHRHILAEAVVQRYVCPKGEVL
jgi:hypothetical protein